MDILFANSFGNDWKFGAGEIKEGQIFESRCDILWLLAATSVCIERFMAFENDLTMATLGRNSWMFLVHVIFQFDHAVEIIAYTNWTAELLVECWHSIIATVKTERSIFALMETIGLLFIHTFSLVWEVVV
jgi:hypothetical protein